MRIESEKFLIGRHSDADLSLESRTISRRHCVIVQKEGAVAIVDLGSRNPTIVNGKLLTKGKPQRLNDRDKVQIGRVKFRVALMATDDAAARGDSTGSNLPMANGESPIESLLDELDEIASKFEVLKGAAAPPTPKAMTTPEHDVAEPEDVDGEVEDGEEQENADGLLTTTIEMSKSGLTASGNAGGSNEPDGDEGPEEEDKGPKKLPAHLRLKGPIDSQEAAEEALRNMFNRR